ncbi:MAG: prepilin-type N-terminal cleavage/methylation domain-containing protein [Caloramator sp.]|nr:prepilin-type N-terminal cleavage/methylation domain-containing protein [Caloramator sp.]
MTNLKRKGFTLIEVLIVLFSIAFLIPVILDINISNAKLNRRNRDSCNMYLIAMSLCEIYKNDTNFYADLKCTIYLNSSSELLDTIEQNIGNLGEDNNKRFLVNLQFKHLDYNLYQLNVEVKDRINGDFVKLSSYK